MKKTRLFFICMITVMLSVNLVAQQSSHSDILKESLVYLKQHRQDPETYVISAFDNHDYVFIGEYHRLKECLEFVQNLIPGLYRAGVHSMGLEFGAYEYQSAIDSMFAADQYDEELIKRTIMDWYPIWNFTDYDDIFRKAWEFNQQLPEGAQRFRVVCLNYAPNHKYIGGSQKRRRKYYSKGSTDAHMARIIFKEFVSKGEKALIYSGLHHSFTKYHQPIVSKGIHYGFTQDRMGNLVYDSLPDRVFHIILHQPWMDIYFKREQPLQGSMEGLMSLNGNRPVGFDTHGTPMGRLTEDSLSYYAQGYEGFTLETITDGYLYLNPLCEYTDAQLDVDWTSKNWRWIKRRQEFLTRMMLFGGKKRFIKIIIKQSKTVYKMPCPDKDSPAANRKL